MGSMNLERKEKRSKIFVIDESIILLTFSFI